MPEQYSKATIIFEGPTGNILAWSVGKVGKVDIDMKQDEIPGVFSGPFPEMARSEYRDDKIELRFTLEVFQDEDGELFKQYDSDRMFKENKKLERAWKAFLVMQEPEEDGFVRFDQIRELVEAVDDLGKKDKKLYQALMRMHAKARAFTSNNG